MSDSQLIHNVSTDASEFTVKSAEEGIIYRPGATRRDILQ